MPSTAITDPDFVATGLLIIRTPPLKNLGSQIQIFFENIKNLRKFSDLKNLIKIKTRRRRKFFEIARRRRKFFRCFLRQKREFWLKIDSFWEKVKIKTRRRRIFFEKNKNLWEIFRPEDQKNKNHRKIPSFSNLKGGFIINSPVC